MALSLFLPDFKGSSSRDIILQVLLEEWPLSAKEVFSRVSRVSKHSLSYQAVHKSLKALESEGVIVKSENGFLVNFSYAENLKAFADKLVNDLSKGSSEVSFSQKMVFSTIYEVDSFLAKLGESLHPAKNDVLALQWSHFWIPLFHSNETYASMKRLILSSNFYSVTPGNAPIDEWCAKFWKDLGVNERIGVKGLTGTDMFIFRDVICQVFYPPEIRLAVDKVYKSTRDPSKLDVGEFFHTVFEKKTRIPVLVSRNPEVAEELKKQIIGCFG